MKYWIKQTVVGNVKKFENYYIGAECERPIQPAHSSVPSPGPPRSTLCSHALGVTPENIFQSSFTVNYPSESIYEVPHYSANLNISLLLN